MKSLKTQLGNLSIAMVIVYLSSVVVSKPESLLDAVHANQITHSQKKLMKKMMKLHNSLKSLDPLSINSSLHTQRKNNFMKKFRGKNKSVKRYIYF